MLHTNSGRLVFMSSTISGIGQWLSTSVSKRMRIATRYCAARVLQEVSRKIDTPTRYGGEEFAVLLDNVDLAQAKQVAERIRISRVVALSDKGTLSVTESIGVAAFPDDGRDRATLSERADLTLNHA